MPSFAQLVGELKQNLTQPKQHVPSGFDSVDSLLPGGGFGPGHVVLVLGRTEVGKSAFVNQLAVNAVEKDYTVLFASLEMTRHEEGLRALSAYLDQPVPQVQEWLGKDEVKPELVKASLALNRLVVDDPAAPEWDYLTAWVAKHRAEGHPAHMVVVDQLSLMRRGRYSGGSGEANRIQKLSEEAKAWAKENSTVLVLVHQVGRSTGNIGDPADDGWQPLTASRSWWGGEQYADVVLGLYSPKKNPKLRPDMQYHWQNKLVLQVIKNRHGPSNYAGTVLLWNTPSFRITELQSYGDFMTSIEAMTTLGRASAKATSAPQPSLIVNPGTSKTYVWRP